MPATKSKKTFNIDLFRKRVRLFDSDSEGERTLAFNQCIEQCHDYEKLFWEVSGDAFGTSTSSTSTEELNQVKQENQRLHEQNAALTQELAKKPEPVIVDASWPDYEILQPDFLTVVLGGVVYLGWIFKNFSVFLDVQHAVEQSLWAHSISMAFFMLWSLSIFMTAGIREMMIRWVVWAGAWAAFAGTSLLMHDGNAHNLWRMYYMTAPLDWWNSCLGIGDGLDLVLVTFFLGGVIDGFFKFAGLRWFWTLGSMIFSELQARLVDS
jgi:hypothetical protein